MQTQFDPLAGHSSPRESILSIWTHQADAEEGTPWRVWQRPEGPIDEVVTHGRLIYGPMQWRCQHNRGCAKPRELLPAVGLIAAGILQTHTSGGVEVADDGLVVAGMRLVIGTVEGEIAMPSDLGLSSSGAVNALIEAGRASRAQVMS